MDHIVTLALLALPIITLNGMSMATESGTFCQNEQFDASCERDEVVFMRTAHYGRMKLSRCVRKDYGYIGCGTDVMNVAHAACSGRRTCEINVPNEQLDANQPCPEDFKSYLEAGYDCMKVLDADPEKCQLASHVEVTSQTGVIASVVTRETGCGSHKAPWLIKALPGQKINLTLVDFAAHGPDGTGSFMDQSRCIAYAILREKSANRRTTLCGGRAMESLVYTSKSHELEILILGAQTPETTRHFLLKYKVYGCANPVAPPGGWTKRTGARMTFGCTNSDDTWHRSCKGNNWVGELGNCTSATSGDGSWPDVPVSLGVSVGIILLIALGIAGCILLAGLICMHRKRQDVPRKPNVPMPNLDAENVIHEEGYKKGTYGYSRQKSINPNSDIYWSRREVGGPMSENEYASIQDGLPPVSPTGTSVPDVDFSHAQGQSSANPLPPYHDTSGNVHPGHALIAQMKRGAPEVQPPRLHSLSHSSGSLDSEGRQYYVLDPDDVRQGHKPSQPCGER